MPRRQRAKDEWRKRDVGLRPEEVENGRIGTEISRQSMWDALIDYYSAKEVLTEKEQGRLAMLLLFQKESTEYFERAEARIHRKERSKKSKHIEAVRRREEGFADFEEEEEIIVPTEESEEKRRAAYLAALRESSNS